ncbi:MAG: hypothetical protein QQN63_01070 [Nitrosopumilus sp.]
MKIPKLSRISAGLVMPNFDKLSGCLQKGIVEEDIPIDDVKQILSK